MVRPFIVKVSPACGPLYPTFSFIRYTLYTCIVRNVLPSFPDTDVRSGRYATGKAALALRPVLYILVIIRSCCTYVLVIIRSCCKYVNIIFRKQNPKKIEIHRMTCTFHITWKCYLEEIVILTWCG